MTTAFSDLTDTLRLEIECEEELVFARNQALCWAIYMAKIAKLEEFMKLAYAFDELRLGVFKEMLVRYDSEIYLPFLRRDRESSKSEIAKMIRWLRRKEVRQASLSQMQLPSSFSVEACKKDPNLHCVVWNDYLSFRNGTPEVIHRFKTEHKARVFHGKLVRKYSAALGFFTWNGNEWSHQTFYRNNFLKWALIPPIGNGEPGALGKGAVGAFCKTGAPAVLDSTELFEGDVDVFLHEAESNRICIRDGKIAAVVNDDMSERSYVPLAKVSYLSKRACALFLLLANKSINVGRADGKSWKRCDDMIELNL